MMTVEIYLLIDSNGDYVTHHEMDELAQLFEDTHGMPVQPTRVYELNLQVPEPKAVSIRADIPDKDQPVTITVA